MILGNPKSTKTWKRATASDLADLSAPKYETSIHADDDEQDIVTIFNGGNQRAIYSDVIHGLGNRDWREWVVTCSADMV